MLHCKSHLSQTRICQAAHFGEHLVEGFFRIESSAGLLTRHTNQVRPFRHREETVTESMLGQLNAHYADVVTVETFGAVAENDVGADWLWILHFGSKLVPMLVQAKKIDRAWAGVNDWAIEINTEQQATLESTASEWNVAAQFCFYAPLWHGHEPCFGPHRPAFMHLGPSAAITTARIQAHDWGVMKHMVPFTCLCCCSDNAEDAGELLSISRQKMYPLDETVNRDSDLSINAELERMLNRARESRHVAGSVVLKMGVGNRE